ncbi:MAG: PrsW family intramembrane metalloprotease [Candidatus Zambryskibacteria bacterium]|nr:PrsW family intramembrane metalloprotease [Candidatus Zambryskibacteria bacterium]
MVINPLLLGIIPSFAWLVFFMLEDQRKPEPTRMILYVFLAGGLSTAFAAFPELQIQNWFAGRGILTSTPAFLFSFALIEELVKFIAVYALVKRSEFFDEWTDGMVYMITAALGFAAVENALNLIGADFIVQVTLIRGVGATLLHALASALVGFYWMRKRVLEGLFWAAVLHGIFNILILRLAGIEIYASLFLLLAAVIVFHDFETLKKRDELKPVHLRKKT